jgi:hypothetical protein
MAPGIIAMLVRLTFIDGIKESREQKEMKMRA